MNTETGPRTRGALAAVVYTSIAVAGLGLTDLADILRVSRLNNEATDITGVLLFFAGRFMQYIEGPPASLYRLYDAICADRRHHDVVERLNEPIAQREFADWRMAFATPELPDADPTFTVRDLDAGAGKGHELLKDFLERFAHAEPRPR